MSCPNKDRRRSKIKEIIKREMVNVALGYPYNHTMGVHIPLGPNWGFTETMYEDMLERFAIIFEEKLAEVLDK